MSDGPPPIPPPPPPPPPPNSGPPTPSSPATPPAPPPLPSGDTTPRKPFDPATTASSAASEDALHLQHATEQSRTYPCGACGGELHFDIATQLLKCQHCGNTHELVEVGGEVRERDLRKALALVRAGTVTHTENFLGDEKEVVCQNCGGHTTFTGSLTADKCPYCATPIQRDDVHAAPKRLPVDAVLPFQVDQKRGEELIEEWINGRWFAPSEFKTYSRTGSFKSVYMAYFTYDADTDTRYRGQRGVTRTRTVGSGENRRTETYTTWHHVSGHVANSFDDIPILANEGFDTNRIDKLEPWPTETAKPYSAEYAAGHLARTYDRDVEQCLGDATSIMESEIRNTIRRDIGGDQQRISRMDVNWREMTYKHILLPIWLLTVIYDQRPFQVYINGVTGEVHGARPYSKVKIAFAVALALLVVIAIFVVMSASGGGSG